jgi:predicted outer membrane repeat protein
VLRELPRAGAGGAQQQRDAGGISGYGISAVGKLGLDGVTIAGNADVGAFARPRGFVIAKNSSVTGNRVGIVSDSQVKLLASTVSGNAEGGVIAGEGDCAAPGKVQLKASSVTGNASGVDCGVTVSCADLSACSVPKIAGGSTRYEPRPRLGRARRRLGRLHLRLMRCARAVAAVVLAGAFAFCGAGAAFAAIFQVASTKDLPDQQIDGVCASAEGTCTLRAAVQEANATPAEDIVNVLPGKYTLKLVGPNEDLAATGDLDVLAPLIMNGSGPTEAQIKGKKDRVLEVFPGAALTIDGLGILKGAVGAKGVTGDDVNGGGILNRGTLTMTNALVSGNKTSDDGGGIGNLGGVVNLSNTTVSKNKAADDAGGIDNDGGTLALGAVNVSKNKAGDESGGVESDGGTVTATAVTFNGNASKGDGGGVNLEQGATFTGTNVTFSGNKGVTGGGITIDLGCTATIVNATFKKNKSKDSGGAIANEDGAITVTNTIFDGNGKVGCSGALVTGGGNVEDTATCVFGGGDLGGVKKVGLAGLKPNNAGTLTHLLKPGSAALDAGNDTACPADDQRLLSRPVDAPGVGTAACDSGAVEMQLDELAP